MKHIKLPTLLLCTAVAAISILPVDCYAAGKQLVDYIDPMIGCYTKKEKGSHGLGKTFPGPCTPFGLVQLSPDTITGGDHGSGYSTHHTSIEGFSFTHMSGIGWYGDLGNFQVMPTTGERQWMRTGKWPDMRHPAKSKYSHDEEIAKAGYYSVNLKRYGIRTELTAAPRAGMIRFTYPEAQTSRIQIDLARRIGMKEVRKHHSTQHVEVVDERTIQGYMQCSNKDGGWGKGKGLVNYTVHFYAQFSKPITQFGVWEWDKVMPGTRKHTGKNSGFYLEFPTSKGEQVLMKVGISFTSVEGAKANLQHDIPGWDFETVRQQARALWSNAIDGVAIEGGTEDEKTVFATCLYHSFIDPRGVSDVDGSYIGADKQVHRVDKFTYRTLFSGWDVFRSQFPFLTIVRPDIVNDQVNSLIQLAELSGKGYLPRWEMLNAYSGCMVGDPAVTVIAEAYQKGIRDYDLERAYEACRKTVFTSGNGSGRQEFNEYGYVPNCISRTLELTYANYSLAVMAEGLGKTEDAKALYQSAMNYRKVYDSSVGNMRAKKADGSWHQWQGLLKGTGCVESNPYQQGWYVPHDVQGLINLMGGTEKFLDHLIPFFDKSEGQFTGWNHYYNHANEPVHHVAYMFPYGDRPWLTQKWVRTIMKNAYFADVKGLCGNEDVGQMSAWYLLSAMGFHPVDPVSGIYIVGSPLFDKITVRLNPKYHRGKELVILAHNNSAKNMYVQSLSLNGKAINRAWLTHEEITSGGRLEFTMGPKPNQSWASQKEKRPPSLSSQQR
ncbi:glycoside hydrolase family 92 protein [Verrucomicrobiaceae bacterium N1E253]|uniref:Glycoside hydrolase family 92 protein n=1 Tax=Oceaniferula marina TaxID=2748318 RepID=A0A851GMG2_9BACT|nr:GH92 family glycosyl hydrolase [Oceaniferula marina]NWK57031.1 glycoside hydrolase family 92 protein [Oceaniferula marina]